MKAYVVGYRTKDEEEKPDPHYPLLETGNTDVFFNRNPKWKFSESNEADAECQILNNMRVSVGEHRCSFSVENLPDNEFSVVCLSHPEPEH